jgi:hypothetical protein
MRGVTPLVNLLVAGPGNAIVIDLIPRASTPPCWSRRSGKTRPTGTAGTAWAATSSQGWCGTGATVGVDKEHDQARGFVVSAGGITVVGKGRVVAR